MTDQITLMPQSGYVAKTRLEKPTSNPIRKLHTKVFINICSNNQVPLPDHNNEKFQPEIIYPLIMNNQWEIPIIVSDERTDLDKKGSLSYVYDCFINDKCMNWVQIYKELRQIVTEWCLESVELRFSISLDRDSLKFPKLSYKGELKPLKVFENEINQRSFQTQKNEMQKIIKDNDHLLLLDSVKELKEEDPIQLIQEEKVSTKPLIQEIDDLKIKDIKQSFEQRSKIIEEKPTTKTSHKEKLKYELEFSKLPANPENYTLLIKIKSQITNGKEYELKYDQNKKSFLLKSNNKNYSTTNEFFEIPIPYFINCENDLVYKCFFDHQKNLLNIFI